jgi:hypothetical protein
MKAYQAAGLQQLNSQLEGKELAQIKTLHLFNCALSPDAVASLSRLTNLQRLEVVDMKPPLTNDTVSAIINALPNRNALRLIDVSDNRISNFNNISQNGNFPSLVRLLLCNNNVSSFGDGGFVLSADRFPSLRTLDLEDNSIIIDDNSNDNEDPPSKQAFTLCPSLIVFNGRNKDGVEFHDPSDEDESGSDSDDDIVSDLDEDDEEEGDDDRDDDDDDDDDNDSDDSKNDDDNNMNDQQHQEEKGAVGGSGPQRRQRDE